jgi:hypothetical protein
VSTDVWKLTVDILNITCNFLYCNHQVQRDFMITLYNTGLLPVWLISSNEKQVETQRIDSTAFYETQESYLLRHLNPVQSFHFISFKSILILSSHLRVGCQVCHFNTVQNTTRVMISWMLRKKLGLKRDDVP